MLHGGVWGGFVNVTKKRYVTLKCYVILDGEGEFSKKNALNFVTFLLHNGITGGGMGGFSCVLYSCDGVRGLLPNLLY